MKKEATVKKGDGIVFVICILLVVGFVVALPYLSDLVRDSKKMDEQEDEKIPVTYTCIRNEQEETYSLKQRAVYTLENAKIIKAEIHRTYQFEEEKAYNEWIINHPVKNVVGQSDEMIQRASSLQVERTIIKDLVKMNPDDLESTFPKTYDNLLIYTKEQNCTPTYE